MAVEHLNPGAAEGPKGTAEEPVAQTGVEAERAAQASAAAERDAAAVAAKRKRRDEAQLAGIKEGKDPDTVDRELAEQDAKGEQQLEPDPNVPKVKPHEIEIEGPISEKYRGEAETFATDVGRLGAEAGISQEETQSLYTMAVDLELTNDSGVDGSNPDATRTYLQSRYGEAAAKTLIEDAKAAVRRLPQAAVDYLEEADSLGRRKGDNPSVLIALAAFHRGDFRMSPDAALKEMTKLRGSKEFLKGDRAVLDRVRALAMTAYREKGEAEPAEPAPFVSPEGQKRAALEAEVASIRRDPNYFKSGKNPLREVLVARMHTLMKLLHGDGPAS